MAATDDTGDGTRVQSIVRAFAILETVARTPEGVGLSDIARRVGLHSSTVFNLARTMAELGYLDQEAPDRRYRIGRPLLCLGANAIDDVLLVNKARAVMEDLSRATGESGTFAVWSVDQVISLARSSGVGAFQLSDRIGGSRPAHATATGKVLLAALPPDRFAAYVAKATFERYTARTIVDARRLARDVARVRKEGLAIDDGEYHDDVCCIAMPVRDFTGKTVGALGVSGPMWRMTAKVRPKRADVLRRAAERLSRELGSGGMGDHYSPAVARLRGAAPAAAPPALPRAAGPARTRTGGTR